MRTTVSACEQCGTETTGTARRRFCSGACRQRHHVGEKRDRLRLSVAILRARDDLRARGATEDQAEALVAESRELLTSL